MSSKLLEAALSYAQNGFSVIPARPDKKPFIEWREFQERPSTMDEIKKWWSKWPEAMIGLVTGVVSDIAVIDIDQQEGLLRIAEFVDGLRYPSSTTPRGGYHYYFKAPRPCPGNNAGLIPGCDFRGEGGYIIAPPSCNDKGGYAWMPGLSLLEISRPPLPDAYLNKIINNSTYRGDLASPNDLTKSYQALQFLTKGRRDNDLFHIANSLIKGGCEIPFVEQVLNILARNSNPPYPENEIKAKIESALKRSERRERNLKQEFLTWLHLTEGYWNLTEPCKTLQILTKAERTNLDVIIHRLKKEGVIEKYGNQAGVYRKVETDIEPVNFLTAPTNEFPISWPLGIHDLCTLYPGNIVIVAGSKSAGKTAFLLNIVKQNMAKAEIVYLNSEMGDTEFRKRLELFEEVKLSGWNFKAYHRSSNFSDLITSERKIFIIDFLEVTSDFWKVAQYIQEIHKKLKEGICIIALQKSEAKDTGRGGDFSKEKARLYLSLDYLPDQKMNQIKIVDAKAWRTNENPRGKYRRYKLVQGSKYLPVGYWSG